MQRERLRKARFTRMALLVAEVVIISYMALNILFFDDSAANSFTLLGLGLSVYIGIYFFATYSQFWLANEWTDVILAAGAIPFTEAMRANIAGQAHNTGWFPVHTTTGNAIIVLTIMAVIFPSRVKWFMLWAACYTAWYAYVLQGLPTSPVSKSFSLSVYLPVACAILFYKWQSERFAQRLGLVNEKIALQKEKTERLLFNVLPENVADRLKAGDTVADAYADVSVIFVDLVGSSALARSLSPKHLIEVLNKVFSVGDDCAELYNVEKVKTIGDAYFAVSGASLKAEPAAAVRFGAEYISRVTELAKAMQLDLSLRIGIHNGAVIGGVIGDTRMAYDYWGDAVNVASRVQAAAAPGGMTVTEPTFFASRSFQAFGPPRLIVLKGIGDMKVYDAIV